MSVTVSRYQNFVGGKWVDAAEGDSAEIINKTRSLKGVMNPLTSEENMRLLTGAGFQHAFPVMKWLSFEGYVAIKKALAG